MTFAFLDFSKSRSNDLSTSVPEYGANDREGVLPNLAVGSDVVGGVDIAVVDLTARDELIDFNGPGAFDLHGIDLLVFDDKVLALRYLVAAGRVLSGTTSPVSKSTFCCNEKARMAKPRIIGGGI